MSGCFLIKTINFQLLLVNLGESNHKGLRRNNLLDLIFQICRLAILLLEKGTNNGQNALCCMKIYSTFIKGLKDHTLPNLKFPLNDSKTVYLIITHYILSSRALVPLN